MASSSQRTRRIISERDCVGFENTSESEQCQSNMAMHHEELDLKIRQPIIPQCNRESFDLSVSLQYHRKQGPRLNLSQAWITGLVT